MQGAYDLWLVWCSFLVAVIASFAALELAGRIVVAQGRATWAWLAGGSVALGLGIWSMHFIGMLAIHLPIALTYDVPITLLSVVPAILSSALVLGLVRRGKPSRSRLIAGAALLGGGIAAMHYTGMAAIPVEPVIRYDTTLFAISITVAMTVAYIALRLAFSLSGPVSRRKKLSAALVMGGAICAMHYTGMAAAIFAPESIGTAAPHAIHNTWLAAIITFNTVFVLGVTVSIAYYDASLADRNTRAAQTLQAVNDELLQRTQRAERAEFELRESDTRFRSLIDLSSDWYWEQDENLRFTVMSGGILRKLGWNPDAFIGTSRWDFPIIVTDEVLAAHKALLAAHEPFTEFVYARRNADGGIAYVSISGIPVVDNNGVFRGYRGVGRDVTMQKVAEETLRAEERRLRLMVEHLPAGAAFVNGDSMYLNPRVEQITGYKPSELSTLDLWFEALYPGQSAEVKRLYLADKASGFPETRIVPIIHKDGRERLLEFAAFGDDSGEVWVINDVTDRVHAEEKFRVLFEHSSDAHLLFDESGVIDCNNAALKMIGCADKNRIVGLHPAVLSPALQPDGRPSTEKVVEMDAMATQTGHHRFEWTHRRLDGTEFPVEVTLTPVKLDGRRVLLTVWHDLTERKRKEAEILQTREQLRLALVGSKLALFEWNIATGEVFLTERWADMIAAPPGVTRTTMDDLTALVHPEDVANMRQQILNVLKGDVEYYDVEHRVRSVAGNWFWIRSRGQVGERDAGGRALRMSGTNAEISERKKIEQALRDAHGKLTASVGVLERRNREIALLSELSNFLLSCASVEEACNAIPKYCELLFPGEHGALYLFRASRDRLNAYAAWGGSRNEVPSLKPEECWALRHGKPYTVSDPQRDVLCAHVAAHDSGKSYMCIPLVVQSELLGLVWITLAVPGSVSGTTEDSRNGTQQLAITLSEQIALALSNIRLREDLRQQTIRDAMTGLYNRRFLEESLSREIARCKRNATDFGVLMIDVDHFKRFNDSFGHDAGDGVLRGIAQVLQKNTREGDIVCRYGGEEFTAVLPDTNLEGATTRATRILSGVRELQVSHNGKTLGAITASIGLAMFPRNGETIKALINAADMALYEAKGGGRDRLIVATDQPPQTAPRHKRRDAKSRAIGG